MDQALRIIWVVFFFLLGLALGSFLNVLIYRLPRNISFVKGRSFCPHCQHTLAPHDLIPLFSFLLLGGHCRYCGKPISWRYPLVEGLFALALALLFWFYGFSLNFLTYALFLFLLFPLFSIDLEHKILPDTLTIPGIFLGLLLNSISGLWWQALLGSAIAGGLFFLISLAWKGGMGEGDVKLALMIGAFIPYPVVFVWFFLAFVIGAIGGLIGIGFFGLKGKSAVPFGPYMTSTALIACFWGKYILDAYLQFAGL